ncbi:MAG: transcription antitermination factor NusB [Deltaproteobacteria bacterium]|nr:transcription antitermination factor NusB [Deltaproteobacteria bacterium]
MGNRRHARESALSYLYQLDLEVPTLTNTPEKFAQHFKVMDAFRGYFFQIVRGVAAKHDEIDKEIIEAAEHWKLYRIGKIDKAILRMAIYELMDCPETSHNIIIDEAVELAKIFGVQESSAFVNGILDKIAKKYRKDASVPTPSVDLG